MLPPSIQDVLDRFARAHGLDGDTLAALQAELGEALTAPAPAPLEPVQVAAERTLESAGRTWTLREIDNSETTLEIWLQPRHFDPMEDPAPGPDRFEELVSLGQGGAAQVLRVWDPTLQRAVALKALHPELLSDPEAVTRFIREARITAQLQHPGIIAVYEQGRLPDGRLYYTMREVRGRTLQQVLREVHGAPQGELARAWPLRRRVEVFLAACEALAYAHAQGVVHLDLKPANLMVGDFSEVQVVDWGLAARLGEAGRAAEVGGRGSPAYMPPEQVRDDARPSPRADVYSLGAVLYEVLCGHAPFGERSAGRALEDLLAGPPPPPSARTPQALPRALEEICLKAMERDPRRRYRDAGELARSVRAWLDGSLRREQAQGLLRAAEAVLEESRRMEQRADELRQRAAQALARVPAHAPEERCWDAWALEDEAEGLDHDAALVAQRGVQALAEAIGLDPELDRAHQRLADHTRARHAQAEARRDLREAARLELVLRTHDRGGLREYLAGEGRLSLLTEPPGAEVLLERYTARGRRLVAEEPVALGQTPLLDHPLAMGSYRLRLRAPGHHEVLYPVHLHRQGRWLGALPGRAEPEPVPLPPLGVLGPDDCYVPAGPFWAGGDQSASDAGPARRLWCAGFIMRRFAVSLAEYQVFLDALRAAGREDEASRHAPRLGAEAAGWRPDWPVAGVGWASADAYARWLAAREGLPWRLPAELEWEKAARGVDARPFPWGDRPEARWSQNRQSQPGRLQPCAPEARPVDESPYGVRHLAGNVATWCADLWREGGGAAQGGRMLVPPPDPAGEGPRAARGGHWLGSTRASRLARRDRDNPEARLLTRGIRLVRSWP